MQNGDLKTNILVSCEKLEKFVVHYAKLHMTSQNDSATELSIEQQEIGKTFEKAVRSCLIVLAQTLRCSSDNAQCNTEQSNWGSKALGIIKPPYTINNIKIVCFIIYVGAQSATVRMGKPCCLPLWQLYVCICCVFNRTHCKVHLTAPLYYQCIFPTYAFHRLHPI